MIQADAKCVNNGAKVNEAITAINPLLNMGIALGSVAAPKVSFTADSVQIILPDARAMTDTEVEIVAENNTPSTLWFASSSVQGYDN